MYSYKIVSLYQSVKDIMEHCNDVNRPILPGDTVEVTWIEGGIKPEGSVLTAPRVTKKYRASVLECDPYGKRMRVYYHVQPGMASHSADHVLSRYPITRVEATEADVQRAREYIHKDWVERRRELIPAGEVDPWAPSVLLRPQVSR